LEGLRGQIKTEKPRGNGLSTGQGQSAEPGITVPSVPEEVKEGLIVVDLLTGELLSSRSRVSAFTNGGLDRLLGAEVPPIMKKMSPQGDEMWSFVHNNIYIEKYERRQDGKLMLSRHVGENLPKAADWTQDKVLDRAARLARRREALKNPGPAYEILTTEGLSWGMKAPKARALFQGRLLAAGQGGFTLVYDREKVSKGFLTVAYKAARGVKSKHAVELIFDKNDELTAIRCGNLAQK
jgi:hypothetical protein